MVKFTNYYFSKNPLLRLCRYDSGNILYGDVELQDFVV